MLLPPGCSDFAGSKTRHRGLWLSIWVEPGWSWVIEETMIPHRGAWLVPAFLGGVAFASVGLGILLGFSSGGGVAEVEAQARPGL